MNMKLVSNIEKKRLTEIKEFLESENIPLTSLVKIKGDASFRVYYRIKNTDFILMDANPKTNEKVNTPAKKIIAFKMSKDLFKILNNEKK